MSPLPNNSPYEAPDWFTYHTGEVAGEQQLRFDKVYVEPGIVEYTRAANISLEQYCASIEPILANKTPTYIAYDPKNQSHVNDIMNEGYFLLHTSSFNKAGVDAYYGKRAFKTVKVVDREIPSDPMERQAASTFIKSIDVEKKNLIDLLAANGIPYSKSPF